MGRWSNGSRPVESTKTDVEASYWLFTILLFLHHPSDQIVDEFVERERDLSENT
jgi:hypothetical protein